MGLPALRLGSAVLAVSVAIVIATLSTTAAPRPAYHHYVALGDSYTAAPFVPLTDIAYGCVRSTNNYPHLVARALRIEDVQDRSCSGAQTYDLFAPQVTSREMRVAAQMDALDGRTDLVTVGIGVNNGHLYARMATVCRKLTTLCRLHDERRTLNAILDRLGPVLAHTLEEVRLRAPNARVLLVSYPKLLPAHGDCPELPRMRPRDRDTFRQVNYRLRNVMAAAAAAARVEFVDYYRASIHHDICAPDPWVQGRKGNAHLGAALHPLPAGQAAVARLLEARLAHR